MIPTKQLRPHRFLTLRSFLSNLCGLLLAVLLLNNTANSATVDPHLLFLSDFETGNIQGPAANPDGWTEQACYDYSFEAVTSPVRAGKHSMKIFLRKSDKYECFGCNGKETHKRARAQLYQDIAKLQHRVGQWTGYSQFIPNDWPATGSVNACSYWGCISYLIDSDGRERWHSRWGTGTGDDPDGTEDVYVEPYTKGEWVDWVMYYYPSWESDGILKIWRNGNLVVNKNGANCIEGRIGWIPLMFKLYKWDWKWTKTSYDELTIYFDEIRVARGPDTQEYYNLVVPPSRSQWAPPQVKVRSP